MKLIDDEWLIRDNLKTIFHICKGGENPDVESQIKKTIKGFWPIKEDRCTVCGTEVPNHVKLYLK